MNPLYGSIRVTCTISEESQLYMNTISITTLMNAGYAPHTLQGRIVLRDTRGYNIQLESHEGQAIIPLRVTAGRVRNAPSTAPRLPDEQLTRFALGTHTVLHPRQDGTALPRRQWPHAGHLGQANNLRIATSHISSFMFEVNQDTTGAWTSISLEDMMIALNASGHIDEIRIAMDIYPAQRAMAMAAAVIGIPPPSVMFTAPPVLLVAVNLGNRPV